MTAGAAAASAQKWLDGDDLWNEEIDAMARVVLAVTTPVTREGAAWQTGSSNGIATYSKMHIWNARGTRMLCGVAPGWRIGNFGPSHSGRCGRCLAIAVRDGLTIVGSDS